MSDPAVPDPVLRDDALLDALRRGTPPPADDPVAALLAGWHTEIEAHAARLDAARRPTDEIDAGPSAPSATDPRQGRPEAGHGRERPGRTFRRRARVLSGAALAIVTMTGGVWLGAARAEPDGLLWPVTELVWTERAESLTAEREVGRLLDRARDDLDAGRYAEARADLARATTLLAGIDDERAARLRAGIEDLTRRLPTPKQPADPAAATTPPGTPALPTEPAVPDGGGTPSAGVPSAEPSPEPEGHPSPARTGGSARPAPAPPETVPDTTTPDGDHGRSAVAAPVRPADVAGQLASAADTSGAATARAVPRHGSGLRRPPTTAPGSAASRGPAPPSGGAGPVTSTATGRAGRVAPGIDPAARPAPGRRPSGQARTASGAF